jgi:hypothetical protein
MTNDDTETRGSTAAARTVGSTYFWRLCSKPFISNTTVGSLLIYGDSLSRTQNYSSMGMWEGSLTSTVVSYGNNIATVWIVYMNVLRVLSLESKSYTLQRAIVFSLVERKSSALLVSTLLYSRLELD